MWTRENRRRYDRSRLRYETDLTDDEWAEIAPLIPPAKPGGNKRSVNLREVVNGVMYILGTGCQWRAIPNGTDVWMAVPASPPLRMTILACLNDRCDECRLPVYRCESEGGQMLRLCASHLRLPN